MLTTFVRICNPLLRIQMKIHYYEMHLRLPRGDRACTICTLAREYIASFFLVLIHSVIRYDYRTFSVNYAPIFHLAQLLSRNIHI